MSTFPDFTGILSIDEASALDIPQIGVSACGATSLLHVLLTQKLINLNKITSLDCSDCVLRKRAYDAPLPQYLASRSVAGCTGAELVSSMSILIKRNDLSIELESSSFISYTHIIGSGLSLLDFLKKNIEEGNGIVATMNLQVLGNDAWHHQIIYGIDSSKRVIYCLNPSCEYSVDDMISFVSTNSSLLIRRFDVLSRLSPESIGNQGESVFDDPKWREYRVKEQIEAMKLDETLSHLVIPANYIGGFAIFKFKK